MKKYNIHIESRKLTDDKTEVTEVEDIMEFASMLSRITIFQSIDCVYSNGKDSIYLALSKPEPTAPSTS